MNQTANTDPKAWIRQELGPRIDALEVAIRSLDPLKPDSVDNLQRLLRGLQNNTRNVGLPELSEAAEKALRAQGPAQLEQVSQLIRLLRQASSKARGAVVTILIIGSDPLLAPVAAALLQAGDRDVATAPSVKDAEAVLREKEVIFIVTDLFLPDDDVRHMVSRLRVRPLTAAVPILVVTSRVTVDDANLGDILPDVDGFFGKNSTAEQIASTIETRMRRAHERVRAAHRDPVTGLLNRAAFGEHFERMAANYDASKEPIAIAVMKIDRFQALCDRYGTALGDKILRHVGAVLSLYFRATDIVARWGGNEFMALFPGEDNQGGSRAIERVQEALAREPFVFPDGTSQHLKLFAGVSIMPDRSSMDNAIDQADRYLLQARTAGPDQVGSPLVAAKRRERVLLFAQSEATARVLNHFLAKEGFEVQTSAAHDEATLQQLETGRVHLIVIDDGTSDKGDFSLLEQLRAMPRFNRTPIVLLTQREEHAARALELGANDYAMKPLVLLSFLKMVRRLLTRGLANEKAEEIPDSILIVGADLHSLIIAGTALQKQGGFQIRLARGGTDGMNQLARHRPATVLLDLKLRSPDAQKMLEAISAASPQPAIVLTVDAEDVPAARAIRSPPIRGVIPKPIQPLVFARQVQEAIGLAAAPPAYPVEAAAQMLKAEMDRIMELGADTPPA